MSWFVLDVASGRVLIISPLEGHYGRWRVLATLVCNNSNTLRPMCCLSQRGLALFMVSKATEKETKARVKLLSESLMGLSRMLSGL